MTKRNIGSELLQAAKEIKAGKGKRIKVNVAENVKKIREKMGMSQSEFSETLSVNVRTVRDWEQGRRKPSRQAFALLQIALHHPKVLVS